MKKLTINSLKGVLIYLNKVMIFIVKRLTIDSLMGVVNSTQRRLWLLEGKSQWQLWLSL